MNVTDSTIIDVFNYSNSCVVVPSHINANGYLFDPANEDFPYVNQLTFSEIRGINAQSNVFRDGFLWFSKDIEETVYEQLGIKNWKDILTDKKIKDIILNPTKEGLECLIKIQSSALFERVRGMLVQLENSGLYDISTRVKNVINERFKELFRGQRISEIKITSTINEQFPSPSDSASVAKLQEEIEALKKLLEQQQTSKESEEKKESTTSENSVDSKRRARQKEE